MTTMTTTAEQRLKELAIKLPAPPEPFGTYAEAVQTGNLLFLTGIHAANKFPNFGASDWIIVPAFRLNAHHI